MLGYTGSHFDIFLFNALIAQVLIITKFVKGHLSYHCTTMYMSQCMRFPTMWYVRPAKPQISLRIRAVWPEPLLVAWLFYDCKATDWTAFGVSKLKERLQRLVRVYTCQNATLLEISCIGSYHTCEDILIVKSKKKWFKLAVLLENVEKHHLDAWAWHPSVTLCTWHFALTLPWTSEKWNSFHEYSIKCYWFRKLCPI